MKDIKEALAFRYATKKYIDKKIDEQTLSTLLEAIRMAPSSYGLQPYRVNLIESKEVREKLREAAWGQAPVTDASHFIVFSALSDVTEKTTEEFMERIMKERGVTSESLQGFRDMINNAALSKGSPEGRHHWAARQAYIGLGFLLLAAATLGIDATPMEGFDPVKFTEILKLEEKGEKAVVIAALGYRAADDDYAKYPKVRILKDEFIRRIV